jgi:lipopolysaccharide transport system permease protein
MMDSTLRPPTSVSVNSPPAGLALPDFGALVRARELLYYLMWRDVKVRYKQTVIGAGWAILQPLLAMLIFTLVFSRMARLDSEGVPYPLFAYTALAPWTFFASAVSLGGLSLVTNERLVTRVWFPRLIIPIAAIGGTLVDFALSSLVLVALMAMYGIVPGIAVLTVPLFVMLALITALGVGTFLAAINVRYRDVRYVIPFLIQVWLFITPVAYSAELVPEEWRVVYALNPMVGVVQGFRWALLGSASPGWGIVSSVGAALVLLAVGLMVFRRLEDSFADVI